MRFFIKGCSQQNVLLHPVTVVAQFLVTRATFVFCRVSSSYSSLHYLRAAPPLVWAAAPSGRCTLNSEISFWEVNALCRNTKLHHFYSHDMADAITRSKTRIHPEESWTWRYTLSKPFNFLTAGIPLLKLNQWNAGRIYGGFQVKCRFPLDDLEALMTSAWDDCLADIPWIVCFGAFTQHRAICSLHLAWGTAFQEKCLVWLRGTQWPDDRPEQFLIRVPFGFFCCRKVRDALPTLIWMSHLLLFSSGLFR